MSYGSDPAYGEGQPAGFGGPQDIKMQQQQQVQVMVVNQQPGGMVEAYPQNVRDPSTNIVPDCCYDAKIESLQEAIVEDIKVKCCFVTKFTRAKDIHAVYNGQEGAQMPSPPPDVQYPLDGSAVMIIPGAIREHTCEVLFEQDSEEKSVATLVLDSILQCPLDLRKTMADNIVLIGGTSMLPGFKHRLLCELRDLMTKPRYKNLLALKSFKFHSPPAKENFVAWLGGAIFGALEILANRSISRDQYSSNNCMLPDWCSMFEYEDKDERANVLLRKEASKEGSASLKKEQSLEGVTTKSTKA